ncbi:uncharacterized protein LOC110702750 [Chenopodium quinoa]|uniref:uncharacterized protein LOC110702750 n=1 Tax=Chenopodium quinoa TaxID=63459 RepID=UPI000B786D24|nr:uncharacterized protein LOC110702750 [Chenopodium quinoa]
MPDSDNPIPDPPTDPVVDPQSQQGIVLCHTQQLNSMSVSLSNKFFGILYQIKGWMCCCNMMVVKKVVNQGYKWVKRIVSNLVGWISRVVCCCGVVVRGRITDKKVDLGTVVTGSIAFLVYENLVYSLVWNVLTKHTQLGALVQKSWQIHMAVGFGTLLSTGLFGFFTAQWTIRWILKLIGQYAEEAAQGGNVKDDYPDSRNEDKTTCCI